MLLGLIFTIGAFLVGLGIGNLTPGSNGWTFTVCGAFLVLAGAWIADKGPSRVKRRVRSGTDDEYEEPAKTKSKKRPRVRVH